jgi:hypothetical protein
VRTLIEKCRGELLERGFRLQQGPPTDAILTTINKGLLLYFDKFVLRLMTCLREGAILIVAGRCLGHNLLYNAEQGQLTHLETVWKKGHHIENPADSREMSDVYGVEHFLRLLGGWRVRLSAHGQTKLIPALLVVLPDLLSQASIDPQSCQFIGSYVNELLRWVVLFDPQDLFLMPKLPC